MNTSYCYILYSKSLDKYYTGFKTLLPEQRLIRHIEKYFHGKYTAKADDWIMFLDIKCTTSTQARKIETHIKKMKSKIYIQNLNKYPEMVQKLLKRYDF